MHDVNLDSSEQVIKVVTRSWVGVLNQIVFGVVVFLLVLVGTFMLARYGEQYFEGIPLPLVYLVLIGLAILIGLALIVSIYVYFASKLTITNQKVVHHHQTSLFSHKDSQLNIARVEDVTSVQPGILAKIFNFGTITVETAGEDDNFNFTYAKDAAAAANLINEQHTRFEQFQQSSGHHAGVGPVVSAVAPPPVVPPSGGDQNQPPAPPAPTG
jgi:uncharacterized membrane protein YdbT with pleckstrin-like domain